MSEPTKFKKGEVVKDDEGNHFIVLSVYPDDSMRSEKVRAESVATREVFIIPTAELHPSDRVAF